MPDAKLSKLDESRLGDEFKALPLDEQRRITAATSAGRVLADPRERDLQRAQVAQMPWARAAAACLFPILALLRWLSLADGHEAGFGAWLAAAGFTLVALIFVRRWSAMRQLDRDLTNLTEDDTKVTPDI